MANRVEGFSGEEDDESKAQERYGNEIVLLLNMVVKAPNSEEETAELRYRLIEILAEEMENNLKFRQWVEDYIRKNSS